jgi:hypothetical protein
MMLQLRHMRILLDTNWETIHPRSDLLMHLGERQRELTGRLFYSFQLPERTSSWMQRPISSSTYLITQQNKVFSEQLHINRKITH